MKVGGSYVLHKSLGVNFYNDDRLAYRFLNGAPNQLTMYGLHGARQIVTQGMTGLYAQDQWTRSRLTLQGGLRFEHIGSHFPDQQIGPNRFIPMALKFQAQDSGVSVKDLMPRIGTAYDLFGNGRTGLKLSVGKYVGFVTLLILAFGASFEFPLLLISLTMVGVLSSRKLRAWRRYAVVVTDTFGRPSRT